MGHPPLHEVETLEACSGHQRIGARSGLETASQEGGLGSEEDPQLSPPPPAFPSRPVCSRMFPTPGSSSGRPMGG